VILCYIIILNRFVLYYVALITLITLSRLFILILLIFKGLSAYIILYCIVLYCTALHCIVSYNVMLCYVRNIMLLYVMSCCVMICRWTTFSITAISCGQHRSCCVWQLDLSTELRKLTSTASPSSCRNSRLESRRTLTTPTHHSVWTVV